MNEQTIDLIAERVIAALREDLEAIAAELSAPVNASQQLTVGEVARRLGVARSTVYAHWQEWGGYKLGSRDKAPIRFDGNSLPIVSRNVGSKPPPVVAPTSKRVSTKRRHRDLLVDAPRFVHDGAA